MKISTKGRYGLRAMVDLAVNSLGEPIALYSIADRQEVSVSYLEQVFSMLRKAGLVTSIKGPQGGYIIADKPSNITVGNILRVLEGDLIVVSKDDEEKLKKNVIEICIKENVWKKINESINLVVDNITLEDLVQEYKKYNNPDKLMYYI